MKQNSKTAQNAHHCISCGFLHFNNITFCIDTDAVPGNPPCLILRKSAFEGAPVFREKGCRDLTTPTVII